MNQVDVSEQTAKDIEFGLDIVSRYVELDVGQTIVVKNRAVLALEAFEGTDRAIARGSAIAKGVTVFKFSRQNQDLRFDVPVVGLGTLARLNRGKAKALVLEPGRVLILEKEKFLDKAAKLHISIVGKPRKK